MKIKYAFLFFVCLGGIVSCKKDNVNADTTGQRPDFAYNVKAGTLLDLVNEVRTKGCNCGGTSMPAVPALTWNDQLGQAAFEHSEDMKENNFFDHDGSDGSNVSIRVSDVGYTWTAVGENIASGQITEQEVMTSWLLSELHCKNIMSTLFKEMGAGRSGNYWTQVLGSK
ncbi:MAG: CAP domain-containing protein [Agriterribacter sp.]